MNSMDTIYILGSGAIGFPLAAYLAHAGRQVVAVRTSRNDIPKQTLTVTVHNETNHISTPLETISLSRLTHLHGTIVITAKSYANHALARALQDKATTGPIVIMQNGVGVEQPFLEAHFPAVYRCVLYFTSQAISEYGFSVRPIRSSPIGPVTPGASSLKTCVEMLTTDGFPFHAETNINREVWQKAIINSVFNSLCPLLEADNGIFARDKEAAGLAREVVRECVMLTDRLQLRLSENELMAQLLLISRGSEGQLISTLQDIKRGRQTEIESLNLEIARIAASLQPKLQLPRTELLGKMILAKSLQARRQGNIET